MAASAARQAAVARQALARGAEPARARPVRLLAAVRGGEAGERAVGGGSSAATGWRLNRPAHGTAQAVVSRHVTAWGGRTRSFGS